MAVSRSRARNKGLNRVAASRGNARNPMGTFRGGLGSSVGAPGAPAPAATLGRGGPKSDTGTWLSRFAET